MGSPAAGSGAAGLRRLDGMWVVRQPHGRAGVPPEGWGEEVPSDALRDLGWRPRPGEADAWRVHGARFLRPSRGALAAWRRDPALLGGLAPARLYLGADGRLWTSGGELLVQAPPCWSRARIAAALEEGGAHLQHAFAGSARLVTARHALEVEPVGLCQRLVDEHGFTRAEPDLATVALPAQRPNDPEYDAQWSWRNTGQVGSAGTAGTPGADVDAERAWRITRGRGAVLALIDNGFDTAHVDLASGVHPNSGHFVSTSSGTTLLRTTAVPAGTTLAHGTMCAGMAGARADNRRQGCGLAPEADLVLISMLGLASGARMARAIEYAANPRQEDPALDAADGADVISCSLNTQFAATTLAASLVRAALRYAGRKGRGGRGTFVVWSAPNSAGSIDADPVYRSKYVAAVAMTDRHDAVRTDASGTVIQGTGKNLAFVAPGNAILSTTSSGVVLCQGTGCSYATPVVAGLAALCLAVDPHLRAGQVYRRIRAGCDKVGATAYVLGRNDVYGWGRVNAGATVSALQTSLGLGPWP